jgi:hypothetical protein
MNSEPQGKATQLNWKSVINAVAALTVLIFAMWSLSYVSVIWNPGRYGDFGLTIGDFALPADNSSYLVTSLLAGYPAEKAGIKLGDRVDASMPVGDRAILTGNLAPHPGEAVTIRISRGNERRTVALKAHPLAPLSTTAGLELAFQVVADFIFVAIGLMLVLVRPSRMTWGFYLFGFATSIGVLPNNYPFSGVPTELWVGISLALDVVIAAGAVGFLAFCVRFPTNAPVGWLETIDSLTPYAFITLAVALLLPVQVTRIMWNVWLAGIAAVCTAGSVILAIRFFRAHGPERHRIRWVVFGITCAAVAIAVVVLSWAGPLASLPGWLIGIVTLFIVAFPLTVAYAVIRHRVMDVRVVISRSLALGVVAAVVSLIVIGLDWLFSTRLPTSRFQTGTYFAIALLIGLSLNAGRQRITKIIDALFFRQWHRSQKQADAICDVIRRATSVADLYEPLTAGIKNALSLTSAALFERVEDGGFVRVAAIGWPPGTTWHILPDDPLVKRADERLRMVDIDSFEWHERDLPVGVARPSVMVPIAAGKRVPAILLYGAHNNGTVLDPDEIRNIRGIAADAGLLYGSRMADVGPTLLGERVAGAFR